MELEAGQRPSHQIYQERSTYDANASEYSNNYQVENDKEVLKKLIAHQEPFFSSNSKMFFQLFEIILKNTQKSSRYELLDLLLKILNEKNLFFDYLNINYLTQTLHLYRDYLDLQSLSCLIYQYRLKSSLLTDTQKDNYKFLFQNIINYILKKPNINLFEQCCIKEYEKYIAYIIENQLYYHYNATQNKQKLNQLLEAYVKSAKENHTVDKIILIYFNVIQFCQESDNDHQFQNNPSLIQIYFYYILNLVTIPNQTLTEEQTAKVIKQLMDQLNICSNKTEDTELELLYVVLKIHLLHPRDLKIEADTYDLIMQFHTLTVNLKMTIEQTYMIERVICRFSHLELCTILRNLILLNSDSTFFKICLSMMQFVLVKYPQDIKQEMSAMIWSSCLLALQNTVLLHDANSLLKLLIFIQQRFQISLDQNLLQYFSQLLNKVIIFETGDINKNRNLISLAIIFSYLVYEFKEQAPKRQSQMQTDLVAAIEQYQNQISIFRSSLNQDGNTCFEKTRQKFMNWIGKYTLESIEMNIQKQFRFDRQQSEMNAINAKQGLNTSAIKIGFTNLGNTCYINSFMQSLFASIHFRKYMLKYSKQVGNSNSQSIYAKKLIFIKTCSDLFCHIKHIVETGFPSSLSLSKFIDRFPDDYYLTRKGQQQDVHEFLMKVMNYLSAESNLVNFFNIIIYKKAICLDCSKLENQAAESSPRLQESQYDIQLRFTNEEIQDYTQSTTLLQMLQRYFGPETLQEDEQGDNRYQCKKCNKKSDKAVIQIKPLSFPSHLIITLCRYDYDRHNQAPIKITNKVEIPKSFLIQQIFDNIDLELEDISDEYLLYAVICHEGPYINSGHYVVFIRDLEENPNNWYLYNDNQVQLLDVDIMAKLESYSPYMLFYANKAGYPLILDQAPKKQQLQKEISNLSEQMQ